jgi:hypothetical protein
MTILLPTQAVFCDPVGHRRESLASDNARACALLTAAGKAVLQPTFRRPEPVVMMKPDRGG